jgi:tRNA pseudouridine32 synthase / 23S rRNA pseudouridine746 synthase
MSVNRKPKTQRAGAAATAAPLNPPAYQPESGLLVDRVLFIDAEALVVDKPAGLPVDAPRDGALSVENHITALCFGFVRIPLSVHRLDRDTSGCLLLARNPKAARRFTAAFEAGTVGKSYLAVLDGVPEETQGRIDMPLGKTSTREAGWRMVVDPRGKSAVTHWQLLTVRDGKALVLFRPETGRTHQLRAHALYGLKVGISGDPVYRVDGKPAPLRGAAMLLHARSITLPRDGKAPIHALAPVPASFTQAGFADANTLAEAVALVDV